MYLIAIGAAITAVAGLGLATARSLSSQSVRAHKRVFRVVALGMAMLFQTGLAVMLVGALLGLSTAFPDLPVVVVGPVVGVALVIGFGISTSFPITYRWATRRPLQLNAPGFILREAVANLLISVGIASGVLVATSAMPPGAAPWAALAIMAAAYPLFNHSIKPRLLFRRSRATGAFGPQLVDLEGWTRTTARGHGLGQVHLAVIPGNLANAYATGTAWLGRHVLLGEGLIKHMSERQIRAIVAHELAHLIRRDVRKLIVISFVTSFLYLGSLALFAFPLFERGRYIAGGIVAAVSGLLIVGMAPGFFSRRIETATDRLGVKLTGDAEAACSSLFRLAEVNRYSVDRWSMTHPPISQRVEAIRGDAT